MQHRRPRRVGPGLAAGVVVASLAVVALLGVRPAGAHAFLVGATPTPGARLATAPARISLRFSEALSSHGSGIELARAGGGRRALAISLTAAGTAIEARLPQRGGARLDAGVYTVAWRAVSAVDGHLTSGSFSFGVGRFSGILPAPTTGSPLPNPLETIASWLVVGGAAAALGGLTAPGRGVRASRLVLGGLGSALTGAAIQTVVVLASAGTSPPRLAYLAVGTAAAVAAALAVLPWTGRRELPLALTVAALVAWVGAGHGPAQAGALGWVTEGAHVVAVSAWVGIVLQAAITRIRWLRRGQGAHPGGAWAAQGRLAALALVGVAGTGVALAFEVLPGPGSVLSSTYGRILMAKTVLLVGAVGLAVALRFRAEAAAALAAVAAGAVLAQVGPPSPGVAATALLGPAPLAGPLLRSGGLAGDLTVGLALGPRRLEIDVYAGQAQLVGTTVLVSRVAGPGRAGPIDGVAGCGAGCFSARFVPPPGTERLAVAASAPGWRGGVWVADVTWPPPAQDQDGLRRVAAAVAGLPRVHVVETVRTAGAQAPPAAEDVTGAALLRDEPWARGADYVTALPGGPGVFVYLPGGPVWDTLTLDGAGRPLTEEIVTSGNRIDRQFSYP
ncbi:MAG TPA: copper resistance protein CopC [Acidimicrobiales bacterium]|nr:copper resistance protein CopC [Acidimicrobiales bacterium]